MKLQPRMFLATLLFAVLAAGGCSTKRPDSPSASPPSAGSEAPTPGRGEESLSSRSDPRSGDAAAKAGGTSSGQAGRGGEHSPQGASPNPGSSAGPTRAERIETLDRRYYEALSRSGSANAPGDSRPGGLSRTGAGGAGEENGEEDEGLSSRPASGIRGDENGDREGETSANAASGISGDEDTEEGARTSDPSRPSMHPGSGDTPKDIPPADNDDEFARQIRRAAENETDPERRRKLWNEYRRYKGLSTRVEDPETRPTETPQGDAP